jgi:hypothetical protein
MGNQAHAQFTVAGWEEQTWEGQPAREVSGAKLTQAEVAYTYQGDVVGEGTLRYLMYHRTDGTASFVGLERIAGSIAGRSGSFVLHHTGTYANGTVTAQVEVVPGSGTDALAGLRGTGSVEIPGGQQPPYRLVLDYDVE